MKLPVSLLLLCFIFSSCATSRDLTSAHYLPEWENRVFNFPAPSESSAGHWAARTGRSLSDGIQSAILFPFAVLGNIAVNACYIPTWPFRWLFHGDKRLIVWYPLFDVGEEVGSRHFSSQWNEDLA